MKDYDDGFVTAEDLNDLDVCYLDEDWRSGLQEPEHQIYVYRVQQMLGEPLYQYQERCMDYLDDLRAEMDDEGISFNRKILVEPLSYESVAGSISLKSAPKAPFKRDETTSQLIKKLSTMPVDDSALQAELTKLIQRLSQKEGVHPKSPVFEALTDVTYVLLDEDKKPIYNCLQTAKGIIACSHEAQRVKYVQRQRGSEIIPFDYGYQRIAEDLVFYNVSFSTKVPKVAYRAPRKGDVIGIYDKVNDLHASGIVEVADVGVLMYQLSTTPGACGSPIVAVGVDGATVIGIHNCDQGGIPFSENLAGFFRSGVQISTKNPAKSESKVLSFAKSQTKPITCTVTTSGVKTSGPGNAAVSQNGVSEADQ